MIVEFIATLAILTGVIVTLLEITSRFESSAPKEAKVPEKVDTTTN